MSPNPPTPNRDELDKAHRASEETDAELMALPGKGQPVRVVRTPAPEPVIQPEPVREPTPAPAKEPVPA